MDKALSDLITEINSNLTQAFKLSFFLPNIYPSNLEVEKHKFLLNKNYNPQFTYDFNINVDEFNQRIKLAESSINKLRSEEKLYEYFKTLLENCTNKFGMKTNVGDERLFTEFEMKVHPWEIDLSNEEIISLLVKDDKDVNNELFPAEVVMLRFIDELKSNNLNDWDVNISTNNPYSVTVAGADKKIKIGQKIMRSELDIKRLISHEIQGHAFRSFNAMQQLEIFQSSFLPDIELIEEGLAILNEFRSGLQSSNSFNNYVLRLLGVKNFELPFNELFNLISTYTTDDKAFVTTSRIKRGLRNTEKPGGSRKDAGYLLGYNILKTLDNTTIKYLYNGKITLNEKFLIDYKILKDLPNKKIPHYYD